MLIANIVGGVMGYFDVFMAELELAWTLLNRNVSMSIWYILVMVYPGGLFLGPIREGVLDRLLDSWVCAGSVMVVAMSRLIIFFSFLYNFCWFVFLTDV